MKNIFFCLLIFSGTVGGCVSDSKVSCNAKLRAVIDLGSGSTKLNMAEVDTCGEQPRVVRKIAGDNNRAVALEAAKDAAGNISPEARLAAIGALNELRVVARETAASYKYDQFELAVVGTHALRTATNKDEFLRQIEDAGFSVRALTQDEEAMAGFNATVNSTLPDGCDKNNLLVWDVGGGSAQFTRASGGGDPMHLNLPVGSESFRKSMLKFKKASPDPACPQHPESPNPIGARNLTAARASVARTATVTGTRLSSADTCVIGIGGVHTKAIAAQVEKNWNKVGPCSCGVQPNCLPTPGGYSKKELQCLAEFFVTKDDCSPELKGPYAKTAASSLIMVLGFLDQLRISRVHVMNINMGDYFLTGDKLLKFGTVAAK